MIEPAEAVASRQAAGPVTGAVSSANSPPRSNAEKARRLIDGAEGPSQCVQVWDAMTAQISEERGFPMVYLGGAHVARAQFGFGYYNLLTITEQIEMTSRICDAINIPLIADTGTAGFDTLNTVRHVPLLEKAGAAGVLIEDLYGAKHLGPGANGNILSKAAMVDKLKAAVDSRRNSATVIWARSDVPDRNEMFERMHAYAEAGADALFPALSRSDISELARVTDKPIVTADPGQMTKEEAKKVGISIVAIYPLQPVMVSSMAQTLDSLRFGGAVPNPERIVFAASLPGEERDKWQEAGEKYNVFRY